jgi:hypothetical protein
MENLPLSGLECPLDVHACAVLVLRLALNMLVLSMQISSGGKLSHVLRLRCSEHDEWRRP